MCQETWFAVQKYKKIIYDVITERIFLLFNMQDVIIQGLDKEALMLNKRGS
jgi:hypothetical protein